MTEKLKNLIEDELESAFVHGRTEAESEYRDLLDKAKDEAYKHGYDYATEMIASNEQSIADKAYQRGLDDAWKCAKKLFSTMSDTEIEKVFPVEWKNGFKGLMQMKPQYAIEKLKAYEEKQNDKIEVGDEVEVLNSGNKYLVAWIKGTSLCGFAHDGVNCRLQPSDVRKTGRHFDIASILKEMRHD